MVIDPLSFGIGFLVFYFLIINPFIPQIDLGRAVLIWVVIYWIYTKYGDRLFKSSSLGNMFGKR